VLLDGHDNNDEYLWANELHSTCTRERVLLLEKLINERVYTDTTCFVPLKHVAATGL
jgi:hypothetical protein